MRALAAFGSRHLGLLFGVFVLTPVVLCWGLPLVFISLIFTIGIGAALHPLAGMLVPLSFGVPVAFASRHSYAKTLSRRPRLVMAVLAGCLAVLALLSSGIDVIGHTLLIEQCTNCADWDSGYHWLVLAPALSHLPLTFAAAVTGARWTAVAFATSAAILVGQALIVSFLIIGFALSY